MYPHSVIASAKRSRAFPVLALATQKKDVAHTKEAQWLLNHNRHGVAYYTGAIDGDFGAHTAAACVKAKTELGYPERDIVATFGPELRSYLVVRTHPAYRLLPKSYQATAKRRAEVPFRVKVLDRALLEVGYREVPKNETKFGREYGLDGVAWCAIFVSCEIGFNRFRYSYVPYILADARSHRHGLAVTNEPHPGDLVCFDWNRDGTPDHVGFFRSWVRAGEFLTVEGNTTPDSNGDQSNGGGVYSRHRFSTSVEAFVSYS